MARIRFLFASILLAPAILSAAGATYQPVTIKPPEPMREFRGAWIATVANIDWPSKPGLGVAEQKAELIALLDRAAQLKLNAVIFQVRPACDAMYVSPIEPWSEYLTGTMGRAPEPFYDPLAFAIAESHRRGLELHAWFNPFRALHPRAKSPVAPNHISRTHPELVRRYGDQLWLDPGEPVVREYVLRVVMDVVQRYDVDGVQFDDYFYPDPEKDAAGHELDFPDNASWRKRDTTVDLNRDDWRRANVNQFIQRVYQSIKSAKPWVKFGVSPKGIWRPGYPPPIRGMDAYAKIHADSRKWLANGWLDYFSPELYWPIEPREQSFPVLLKWWTEQNSKNRHLWPGLAAFKAVDWKPDEIQRQMQITRKQSGVTGCIFYSLSRLMKNPALAEAVRSEYTQPALVPATPWIDSVPPDKPKLVATADRKSGAWAHWETSGGEPARWWLLQFRTNGVWAADILPANQTERLFEGPSPDVISLRAVDRLGNASEPAAVAKREFLPYNRKRLMVSEGL